MRDGYGDCDLGGRDGRGGDVDFESFEILLRRREKMVFECLVMHSHQRKPRDENLPSTHKQSYPHA